MKPRASQALAVSVLVLISCRFGSGQSSQESGASESATVSSAATSQESSVVLRRVWANSEYIDSRYLTPSPDGRLMAFVDWDTGDLAIRDLATGETRRLTDRGSWSETAEYPTRSAFSPDGSQIAVAWASQLRVIDVDDSTQRLVFERPGELSFLDPQSWSPDGEYILTFLGTNKGAELALISSEDGSHRTVREGLRSAPFKSGFSPDGRYVAYDQRATDGDRRHDVVILAVETGREVTAVGGPGDNEFLAWAPDGSRIYFYSDVSGTPSIWAVPVSDGEASGTPELIRRAVENLQPVGVGGDRLFYTVGVESAEVQTMAVDIPSGQILTGPTPEVGPSKGISSGFPAWSMDGRYLAYVHVPVERAEWEPNLVYRSVSGNNLRQLTIPVEVGYPGWIQWAPESEGILVAGGSGTFLVSLTTGKASPVLEHGVDRAALSQDGKSLYAPVGDGGVAVYDLETGGQRVLYQDDSRQQHMMIVSDLSLAPDGETLAIGFRAGVALLPVSGGELRWIYRTEPGEIRWRGGMGWTPDGQYVVFVKSEGLWSVPVAGGEARRLFTMDNLRHVRLHPDGRRLAFVGGSERGELWVMEDAPGFTSGG